MKERDFLNYVVDTARRFGWRSYHVPAPTRYSQKRGVFVPTSEGAGLPDLILLHSDPPLLIFAELKGDGGRVTDAQREFLHLVGGVAHEIRDEYQTTDDPELRRKTPVGVYVWVPGDEEALEMILRSKVLT